MEGDPYNKRYWMRATQYGATEGSKEHSAERVFKLENCVLCALEAVGWKLGLTKSAIKAYLDPRVEAFLCAVIYYLVIKPSHGDKWVDKVGNFVSMNFGYFSTEQIAVGYDDPIWAVAIETDRPECFKEWSVFDFEDDTKKDGNNLDISLKKKKKLLKFEPVELVVP